jgi:hypothetical protein
MESICDAPFRQSLGKTKSNIFRLARPSKSLKRKKDAGSKQADLQSGIQTDLCNLSRISGANGKHNAICILRSNRSSCETVQNFQKAELTEHPPEAIAFL